MDRAIAARRPLASVLALAVAASLSACGGGGGSGSPAPSPAATNRAPTFTSGTTATSVENSAAPFYTAAATDADGDAIAYAISGGADAGFFTLNGGALAFAPPRNFDLPTDSNRDNVYQVTLAASDGKGGTATLSLSVSVTNSKEGISVRRVATGLTNAVALASGNNASELLIGYADGATTRMVGSTGVPAGGQVAAGYASGLRLLGLVQRPGSGIYDGLFRVFRANDGSILLDRGGPVLQLASGGGITNADAAIAIGRLGELVVAVGDPSGNVAQSDGSGYGKMWRIDNVADPYAGASPRFFQAVNAGKGIRQPGGMAVVGGVLAFTDRGATRADEISEFLGGGPANFGWPFIEGEDQLQQGAPASLVRPIFAMPLGTGARESGGLIGPSHYVGVIASLTNHIVIADRDGSIWSYSRDAYAQITQVGPDRLELRTEDFRPDAGSINAPVAIAQDAQGTIYILDGDGELFRVEAG